MPEGTEKKKRKQSGTKIYHRLLMILFVAVIFAVTLLVWTAMKDGIGYPVSSMGQAEVRQTQSTTSTEELTEPTEVPTQEDESTEPPTEAMEPEELIEMYMQRMTLEDKVWQMMFVTMDQLDSAAGRQYPVGGLYFRAEDLTDAQLLSENLFSVQATAGTPIMFGVTQEGGSVAPLTNIGLVDANDAMRVYGDAGDAEAVYRLGLKMGQQIAAAGFHFNMAPIADTYNWYPSEALMLGERTFGTNEDVISGLLQQMVAQMVKGLQEGGTISCMKHFPNFASTAPSNEGDFSWLTYEKFNANDFLPFVAGIEAGVQMVLVSNMYAPNLTGGFYVPCCRAKEVVTDILRTQLGFTGVILTDDQRQQTDLNNYVQMVQAGCDVIYLPADAKAAVETIVAAVENGTISEERINESVVRILSLKCENGVITQ